MSAGAWYDTAQMCINGHVITASAVSSPSLLAAHCDRCGARTITSCEACEQPIRGYYNVPGFVGFSKYEPPSYCHSCGEPYPWMKARLHAGMELAAELEGLNQDEISLLKESLQDVANDGPRAELGVSRAKRILGKAGPAGGALYKIFVDVSSDTIKKLLTEP